MSALTDEFYARLKLVEDNWESYIYSCSAESYSDYSKVCGKLEGIAAARLAYQEALEAVGEE